MSSSVTLPRTTLYTQVVYSITIGSMISTTQNMMAKLLWLATASHAVRLLDGASDDGITNGNIDAPAVRMIPATVRPLARNAGSVQRRALQTITSSAPAKSAMGSARSSGQRL